MGAAVERWPKGRGDRLQDAVAVLDDVVVPKAEQAPAQPPQPSIAQVMFTGACMLPTIGFDNQPRLDAREIDDVRRDRELPAKAPAELVATPFSP